MPSSTDCRECGEFVSMTYECSRCGGHFCSSHRLPENHNCSGSSGDDTEKMFGGSVPGLDDDAAAAGRSASSRWLFLLAAIFVALVAVGAAVSFGML